MDVRDSVRQGAQNAARRVEQAGAALAQETENTIAEGVGGAAEKLRTTGDRFMRTLVGVAQDGGQRMRDEGFAFTGDLFDDLADLMDQARSRMERRTGRSMGEELVAGMRSRPLLSCTLIAGSGLLLMGLLRRAESQPYGDYDDELDDPYDEVQGQYEGRP